MQDQLIYGRQYKLWRDGEYIGDAAWTEDENVGDSFIKLIVDKQFGIISQVYIADEWELIE